MSFYQWTSVLERQQGVSLAIFPYALLDELISESSNNKDSSLSEEYQSNSSSGSSSSGSMMLPVSGSSGTRSEMSNVSSIDSTSNIDDLLGIVAQVHDQMETGMEDNTIQWGKDCSFKI